MMSALVHGKLVRVVDVDGVVEGRVVLPGDKPIQFVVRKGALQREILQVPLGSPVAIAGELRTTVGTARDGEHYVRHEILMTSLLAAQPSFLRRGWRALTGALNDD